MDKFLLFGDSITEYSYDPQLSFSLGAALTNDYVRKMDVVNKGFAGYTSRWGLKILPKILSQEPLIKISTLFFGTNDSISHGHQHVPLDEYKENIKSMIKLFKEKDIKVIVISPAFHGLEQWNVARPDAIEFTRSTETNKIYTEALRQIAKDESIAFVDTFQLFKDYEAQQDVHHELLSDGIHFTGKAYQLLYDELTKQIEKWYPEYSPSNLEKPYPDWKEVKVDEL